VHQSPELRASIRDAADRVVSAKLLFLAELCSAPPAGALELVQGVEPCGKKGVALLKRSRRCRSGIVRSDPHGGQNNQIWLRNSCERAPRGRIFLGDGRRGSSMVEKRLEKSRREVIRAVATGVPAGLLLRISQTEASEKMTPQQTEYQDTPKDIYSCGMCTLFEPPKYCKVVAGEISRDGWCKAFVLAD
jgi:hypothetical protein